MTPVDLDTIRRLEELREAVARLDQRVRAIALAMQQDRRDAVARARAPVPPPAPEPPPRADSTPLRVVALLTSGWPGVAIAIIFALPIIAGVLVWVSSATATPLPSLLLALFGAVPHADPSSGP